MRHIVAAVWLVVFCASINFTLYAFPLSENAYNLLKYKRYFMLALKLLNLELEVGRPHYMTKIMAGFAR